MNKIVLKINMVGEKDLNIKLVYLTDDLKSSFDNDKIVIKNLKIGFWLYSKYNFPFGFTKTAMRFPDALNYKNKNLEYSRTFDSDNDRYQFLKKLYTAIAQIGDNYDFSSNTIGNNKIIMNDCYWVY